MGSVADVEEEQKTTSSIVIQATEQLVDVKVLYYNAKTLPNNGL